MVTFPILETRKIFERKIVYNHVGFIVLGKKYIMYGVTNKHEKLKKRRKGCLLNKRKRAVRGARKQEIPEFFN